MGSHAENIWLIRPILMTDISAGKKLMKMINKNIRINIRKPLA